MRNTLLVCLVLTGLTFGGLEEIPYRPFISLYMSETGEYFIYDQSIDEMLYYSSDGRNFFQLYRTGFGGSFDDHHLSFEDPHHGDKKGEFYFKNDMITMGEKTFRRFPPLVLKSLKYHSLPTVRQAEYLFRFPNGEYLCVSADKYRYSYESFRLFLGPADQMRPVLILNVERFADGGTTYVVTEKGRLFAPHRTKDGPPTWQGDQELEELDPAKFDIQETTEGVILKPKS